MRQKSQQHQEFPSGLPSKYYPGPMLLNFSDRTRTGVFNMVWPLARMSRKFSLYKRLKLPCTWARTRVHRRYYVRMDTVHLHFGVCQISWFLKFLFIFGCDDRNIVTYSCLTNTKLHVRSVYFYL